jgi:ABC-type nitrate/sulfonate/bicarbonate transport system substrate-binding protein
MGYMKTKRRAVFCTSQCRVETGGVRIVLLAITLLLASSCGDSEQASDSVKKERLNLRFGVPAQPTSALSIVALEYGFFVEAGLNVSAQRYPSGKRALHEALFTGRVDAVAAADAPVSIAAFSRNDFAVLGSLFKTGNANRIVARSDRGIKHPADLRGRRIGTQRGSAVHYFLHLFLAYHGLSEKDVQVVFMKAEELPNALVRGDIDAFSMREPYVSLALAMLPEQAHAMEQPGLYTQMDLLVINRDYLNKNPKVVRRLLRALKAAEDFIEQNPTDAVVAVARYLGSPKDKIQAIWPKLKLKLDLDASVIKLLDQQVHWIQDAGLAKDGTSPDFYQVVKPEPLRELWPERVQIR